MKNFAEMRSLNNLDRFRIENAQSESREALLAEILRLRRYVKELERAADADPLSPVYNRRAFIRELVRAQSVAQRYEIFSYLLFIDLDDFKSVNDRYGHVIGDDLLIKVGMCLQDNVRDCDLVARLGGDEFGVLFFSMGKDETEQKARDLIDKLQEVEIQIPGTLIKVSASWGCAAIKSGQTPERILSTADKLMYDQKNEKKRLRDNIGG